MIHLRHSTSAEEPLQASKWLAVQMLISHKEMTHLIQTLGDFFLILPGVVPRSTSGFISSQEFLTCYQNYIDTFKSHEIPNPGSYQQIFSSMMTVSPELNYTIPVDEQRQLNRAARPIIQMQAHTIDYSPVDKKFRSMVFGNKNIPWGIQFSYPQLFRDPTTKEILNVKNTPEFPNTRLFQTIQKWMRQSTIPTPFSVEGVTTNVPMRLGRDCFSWINEHPSLVAKNIRVMVT